MPPHATPYLDLAPEVAAALAAGRAVVALESTIVSHGMPWPENLATAQRVEAVVRGHGAVPATVAVVGGRLKAGLSPAELQALARGGPAVAKASRRDLPRLLARGATGATTVAATMIVAAQAGIRVFATGGIGGVHRGWERTLDVSADLHELARTPVAVVCAGAKAILDLPATLELLETLGVPVLGYRTDELPAFYSRRSGLALAARCDTPAEAAALLHAQWAAGLGGGAVIAQPIAPEHEIPREQIDGFIAQALDEARTQGVAGAASTPFLLARVAELTGGRSLAANIALVQANAALAAQVAVALAAQEAGGPVRA
jgi:pseudouridine-5'-phosphate glycosidase